MNRLMVFEKKKKKAKVMHGWFYPTLVTFCFQKKTKHWMSINDKMLSEKQWMSSSIANEKV